MANSGVRFDSPEAIAVVFEALIDRVQQLESRINELEYAINVRQVQARSGTQEQMQKAAELLNKEVVTLPADAVKLFPEYSRGLEVHEVSFDMSQRVYLLKLADGSVEQVNEHDVLARIGVI